MVVQKLLKTRGNAVRFEKSSVLSQKNCKIDATACLPSNPICKTMQNLYTFQLFIKKKPEITNTKNENQNPKHKNQKNTNK